MWSPRNYLALRAAADAGALAGSPPPPWTVLAALAHPRQEKCFLGSLRLALERHQCRSAATVLKCRARYRTATRGPFSGGLLFLRGCFVIIIRTSGSYHGIGRAVPQTNLMEEIVVPLLCSCVDRNAWKRQRPCEPRTTDDQLTTTRPRVAYCCGPEGPVCTHTTTCDVVVPSDGAQVTQRNARSDIRGVKSSDTNAHQERCPPCRPTITTSPSCQPRVKQQQSIPLVSMCVPRQPNVWPYAAPSASANVHSPFAQPADFRCITLPNAPAILRPQGCSSHLLCDSCCSDTDGAPHPVRVAHPRQSTEGPFGAQAGRATSAVW